MAPSRAGSGVHSMATSWFERASGCREATASTNEFVYTQSHGMDTVSTVLYYFVGTEGGPDDGDAADQPITGEPDELDRRAHRHRRLPARNASRGNRAGSDVRGVAHTDPGGPDPA